MAILGDTSVISLQSIGNVTVDGTTRLNNQLVVQTVTNGAYNEGIRINKSGNNYATFLLGGNAETVSGAPNVNGGWWVSTNPSNQFVISNETSSTSTASLWINTDKTVNIGKASITTLNSVDVGSSPKFTDANVTATKITYPSSTTNYYIVASSTETTNTDGLSKFGTDARVQVISGTTSREGVTEIILGNSTATGTANNTTGKLCLYNAKGKYQLIVPHTTATANYTVTTPGVSGEMVVHTAGSKVGDTNKPVYIATTGAATAVTSLDATLLSGTIPTSCYSSDAVTITGDQTITGYKTIENQLAFNRQSFAKGTVPSADIWPMFNPVLETGTGTAIKNRLAAAAYYVDTTGNSSMELWAYKNTANATDYTKMGITYPKTGNPYAFAPTPDATSNTTHIATTAWVRTYASPVGHTHSYAGSASAGGPANSALVLAGNPSSRQTSANVTYGDNTVRHYVASSSMSTGKPPSDAGILHIAWDNTGKYDGQIAISTSGSNLYYRSQDGSANWGTWKTALATTDVTAGSTNGTISVAGTSVTAYTHPNTVTAGTAGTSSATSGITLAVPYVTYNANGHITATGTHTHTIPNFVKSGSTAAAGLVPTPGTTAGTTKYLREDASWQVPQDTTYTGSDGISLSGTTFTNSGVRSIATGTTNGTISVNTNGTSADVAVKGLGSMAYDSGSYLPLSGGAMTGSITSSVNKSISLSRSGSSDECFVAHAKRTDTTHEIQFGIGSGGTNRGIWDSKKGDWILYRDADGNAYLQSNGTNSKEFKVDTTGYGYLATAPIRDNTMKVATTAFVWANAARHISAATTIYVSSTAAGNASGSSAANAMSISDFQVYVAAARINYSTSSLTNSRTLTVCFVPTGTSYGDFYIDDTKMPGVKNLTITTSTGTNSTTDNYTTNSPVFSNIYVRGHLMVTIKNVTVTGAVQALYGADVTMVTFVDATKFYAAYWGILRFTAGTYQIHNAGRDYLFQAAQGGRIYINANNTYFHFAEQCYYTGAIFQCDLQCYLYIYYSYLRWTGPKPVVAITSSGTINGTSPTAAATAEKTLAYDAFELVSGATVLMKFAENNTAENPTLNVNETGAIPIYFGSEPIPASYLGTYVQYKFTYDGTNYVCNNTLLRLDYVTAGGWLTTSGNYSQTYKSGDWNWTGWSHYYINGANIGGTIYATTFSGNSSTTTKLATARAIDGVSFDGSAARIHYGTCSTKNSTVAKVVACTGYTLVTGSRIIVKFTVTNTANSPTLNVNSTGAKAIQYRGAAINKDWLEANRTYEFVYDGTNYQLIGDINTDTVYTHPTPVTAGTAGTSSATSGITLDVPYVTYNGDGHVTASGTHTHTVPNFIKSGSTAAAGLVPAPSTTAGTTKFLCEDATWKVPPDADTLTTARAIDGVSFDGSAAIVHYGTCGTAAGTAAKTVACTSYTLVTGSRIIVKFTVTNTAASPTLNVNSTGAKAIQYRGAAITAGNLAANRTYEFIYDGSAYQLVGDIDTVYTHPTGAGNNHIPSGGSSGQILTWSASGTAAWANAPASGATLKIYS